jgi:Beta protein
MKLTANMYVPVLKWRQAEYQALFRLSDAAKERVAPLVVIPPIEFDFETWAPKKTVQNHVEPFAKRYSTKWKSRPAWVDIDPTIQSSIMDSGLDVTTHVFDELRTHKANAVPVASLDHSVQVATAIAGVIAKDHKGVALRVRMEHLMRPDFSARVATLLSFLKVHISQTDLIIDLGSPAYEPYPAFAGALTAALASISGLHDYRNFVVTGTAYPESLKDITPPGGDLERHDWKFYQALLSALPPTMRTPNFGDYTVVNPTFVAIDMRMIKPAGKIIYTNKNQWTVKKGGAFRNNEAQMHTHCDSLVKSGNFRGGTFSDGDKYIEQCAVKAVGYGPSNQTRWKEIAISHHTMHVLEDLAKLGGPP